jgi:hypothetical protein
MVLPLKDAFSQIHFIRWMNILTTAPIKVLVLWQVDC